MGSATTDVPKNACEVIRVQATTFRGCDLFDVRVYYQPIDEDDYKPSPKGVSFKRELMPQLIAALQRVWAETAGVPDGDDDE